MHRARAAAIASIALLGFNGCDCGGADLRGLAPSISAKPSPLDFGAVHVGSTARRVLTIENSGDAPLAVASIAIVEGGSPGLAVDSAAFELAPSGLRDVEVRFAPPALGRAEGKVRISSNDPLQPALDVPIVSDGVRRPGPAIAACVESADIPLAKACVEPLRIDFGAVPFGSTKRATITIQSTGTAPLAIRSAKPRPGAHPSIAFSPPDLMTSLAPERSSEIAVSFAPATPEEVNAVFQVESDDPERDIVVVIVTGSGIAPAMCLSSPSLDFGTVAVGQHADRTLRIESCGQVPIQLRALEIATLGSEFSIVTPLSSPVVVPIGSAHEVTLRYSPSGPGSDQDRLVIESDLPDGFVSLIGRAASCDLDVTPRMISFGGVAQSGSRRQRVLVENTGALDCTLDRLDFAAGSSSDFTIASPPALPATIQPGQSQVVEIQYAPSDAGNDTGTLEVRSSDTGEPVIPVRLDGRRLNPGECSLEVRPDPIAFGAVPLGTERRMSIQVVNNGASRCSILQVNLASNSARTFQLVPPALPWLIGAGQTRTVDLVFRPDRATVDTGRLQIFTGLMLLTPSLVVPITGSGSGAQLCPDPNPVIFGTHPVGAAVSRSVRLVSCGTDALQVSSLALAATTSSEYAITSAVSLPLSIAAGSTAVVDVRYTGADTGRDDGILRAVSNDALAPTRDIRLIAAASPNGCGDIQGKICGLDGQGGVPNAKVFVDTPGGRIETRTDSNGDYLLTCVPPGTWSVRAESGSWDTTFSAAVSPYQVTSLPGAQCLDRDSAEIAVVWGQWDKMEAVLGMLNIPYQMYGEESSSRTVEQLVEDPTELARYDIIFFNCGMYELDALTNPGLQNIRDFVDNGGSIYASDYSYDIVEWGWPSAVDFFGDDMTPDAASIAGDFNGLVSVADPTLRTFLGNRPQIPIISCCTGVDSIAASTTGYLLGDRFGDGRILPLMIGFQPTPASGRVFYTDFHNNGQTDIEDVFRWLITQL